jgi:hypothetical protein
MCLMMFNAFQQFLLLVLVTGSSVLGLKGTADYLAWHHMGKVYVNNWHIVISRMNHNSTNTDTGIR